jgi:hypothetical protein
MWGLHRLSKRPVTLDFSSSGQGTFSGSQLLFDGVVFSNALELPDWQAELFQVFVCESCGIENCQPGSWLSVRRLGDRAAFVPAFDSMSEGGKDLQEYSPPRYVYERGAPLLSAPLYDELLALVPGLPRFGSIRELANREAAYLLQAEAPAGVLGRFPARPQIRPDVVDAVSHGMTEQRRQELDLLLSQAVADAAPASVLGEPAETIKFFLATRPIPEWAPLSSLRDRVYLRLEPGFHFRLPSSAV